MNLKFKADLTNFSLAALFFILSTIITWWFIFEGRLLYFSPEKMILSCAIAGTKWGIQIVMAILFLHEAKWIFIKRIGLTCFVGSCILIPYSLSDFIKAIPNSFLLSLIIAIVVMVGMYYRSVQNTQLSLLWFWGWIVCLAIAISLQIFVVFS